MKADIDTDITGNSDALDALLAIGLGDGAMLQDLVASKNDDLAYILSHSLTPTDDMDSISREHPPVAIPVSGQVTLRGEIVTHWCIYRTSFGEQLTSLLDCKDRKRWNVKRASEQVLALTGDTYLCLPDSAGAGLPVSEAELRSMPVNTIKNLLFMVQRIGDLPAKGAAKVIGGDGIGVPLKVTLHDGQVAKFKVDHYGQMEAVSAAQDAFDRLDALQGCCDVVLDYDRMPPADGWFLMSKVFEPLKKACDKSAYAIRSFEFALQMQFSSEDKVNVLVDRQTDYAQLSEKQASARKAAASRNKGRKKH